MMRNLILIFGVMLIAVGYLVILSNFVIAVKWWFKKKTGTMIPFVGSLLILLGWVVTCRLISTLFLIPLLFDLGGLPMLVGLLIERQRKKKT